MSAIVEFLTFMRRDAMRAVAILCLCSMAASSQSWWVAAGITLAVACICLDTFQIHRATRTLRVIAKGDRFVAFPTNWVESGHCKEIAVAGERMRHDLIEADAAIADQRRMLAEERIRRNGASFFTTRFHESVADAFSGFAQRGNEICTTVDNLSAFNVGLLRDAHSVSDAVSNTATDVQAVSRAAADIASIVATTSDQIAGSERAARSTRADLNRARATIDRLQRASHEISTISATIRAVASQTSLLALNATIEAARAGEKGLGFAVVASEVKTLATHSAHATETISRQIEAIQGAVDETSTVIDAIMARVDSLTSAHNAFTASLARSTAAIETVGARADTVAGRVSVALPDLASGVGEIELAGRSVLENARALMDGSEQLVGRFRTYFEDLASGAIKVGVLHSLSGTVTAAERPLHDLLVGLVEETNRNGGLLGRPLEAISVNPRSEAKAYADGAAFLLDRRAAAIFGCWTSQSRRETIPVLEARGALLFYPSQYEGGEASPSVVYAGGTPQQQAWPAVDFLVGKGRRRLVLVGSDSVYSRGTHAMINAYAGSVGAEVALDLQMPSVDAGWRRIAATILKLGERAQLAVVVTLSGDASVAFFREMARCDRGANRLPLLSLSIGEAEMPALDAAAMAGHYVAWTYLHGLEGPANEYFVAMWRRICGSRTAVANDALAATFVGFQLWTQAVTCAGTTQPEAVRAALRGLALTAPSGFRIAVTPDQHVTLPAFVGEIRTDGRIVPVWASRTTRSSDGREQGATPLAA